jgi:hypothetical protein
MLTSLVSTIPDNMAILGCGCSRYQTARTNLDELRHTQCLKINNNPLFPRMHGFYSFLINKWLYLSKTRAGKLKDRLGK